MRLLYRNQMLDDGEVAVTIGRSMQRNQAGAAYAIAERWDIDGFIIAETATAVWNKVRARESMFSRDGGDLILRMNDGTTAAHIIRSRDTVGGVRIVEPLSFPNGRGAEWSTYRSWRAVLEAEIPLPAGEQDILEWSETIEVQGTGGPRTVLIELRNGPPQRQLVSERTVVTATQSGRAVGYRRHPTIPLPLWPGAEDQDQRRISVTSPQAKGTGADRVDTHHAISWTYSFKEASYLYGSPTWQPRG